VSPDGQKLVAEDLAFRSSIVQMNIKTAVASRLIAGEHVSEGAAWAADVPLMAYVTQRNGASEIWLHAPGRPDRPLVTAANAPPEPFFGLVLPAISPAGDRVIYSSVSEERARLWITSTSGGPPVPLTNTLDLELPGSWSPAPGNQFVYLQQVGTSNSLMIVRTSGQATPQLLKAEVGAQVPVWSPNGRWIKYRGQDGSERLTSPDGSQHRDLGHQSSQGWAFSKDSTRLFGIRREGDRAVLFALDVETGAETVIRATSWEEYGPNSLFHPGIRFSLAPDGESLVYGATWPHMNLWLMEGFAPERSLLSRLGVR
jgi:hypothetical protein